MNQQDSVCISAYGAMTPLGQTLDEISHNLQNGITGIREVKKFDTSTLKTLKICKNQ